MSRIGSFIFGAFRRLRVARVRAASVSTAAKRAVVICIGCHENCTLLDKVLEPGDYDVSFLGSIDTAYSDVARAMPDRVILCMHADDENSLRLLSMLNLDPRTRRIEVITCVVAAESGRHEATDEGAMSGLAPTRQGLVMH